MHHSSRKDIETELGIETKDVVELSDNYRNSAPVAKLARAFYTDDPASPLPVPAWSVRELPAWLIEYPRRSVLRTSVCGLSGSLIAIQRSRSASSGSE